MRWFLHWTAAMHAGEVNSPAVPNLSLLVAPGWPQGPSHCGRIPQHSRVGCSAAGWTHTHCQDSREPNTMFCKLIWLYLVQSEFQPLAVISQQFVGTPPALPPQSTVPPGHRSPVIPHHFRACRLRRVCRGKQEGSVLPTWCIEVLVLLEEFTCPGLMPEAGWFPQG